MSPWTSPSAWAGASPSSSAAARAGGGLDGQRPFAEHLGEGAAADGLPDEPQHAGLVGVDQGLVDAGEVRGAQAIQRGDPGDDALAVGVGDPAQATHLDGAVQQDVLAAPSVFAQALLQPVAADLAFGGRHRLSGVTHPATLWDRRNPRSRHDAASLPEPPALPAGQRAQPGHPLAAPRRQPLGRSQPPGAVGVHPARLRRRRGQLPRHPLPGGLRRQRRGHARPQPHRGRPAQPHRPPHPRHRGGRQRARHDLPAVHRRAARLHDHPRRQPGSSTPPAWAATRRSSPTR